MKTYKVRDFYFAAWMIAKGEIGVPENGYVKFSFDPSRFHDLRTEYEYTYRGIFRQVRKFVRLLAKASSN